MNYARLSTVLVVLTIVLAGCSGGGVGADGTETTATGDSTESGAPDSDDGSATGAEQLSVTEADERLRNAGSFTSQWTYSVTESDGTTAAINNTYQVDVESNRSLELLATTGADGQFDIETFIANDTSYSRYGDGADVFYQVNDQQSTVFDSATGRATSFHNALEEDADFVGTETFDGVTVSRYEHTDTSSWQAYGGGMAMFGSDTNATVTDFTVVVLVDSDGISRLTTWTLSGEAEDGSPVSAEWCFALTGIGSTTVEDPDWLDEAVAQQS